MKWHPWHLWECYHAGMYDGEAIGSNEQLRQRYADFLSDVDLFRSCIMRVMKEWPISCEHFLTKPGNRIAWLGQAAMCIHTGVPRKHRTGFMLLSADQQRAANEVARQELERYEAENPRLFGQVEEAGISRGHTGRSPELPNGRMPSAVLQGHRSGDPEERSPDGIVGVLSTEIEMVQ